VHFLIRHSNYSAMLSNTPTDCFFGDFAYWEAINFQTYQAFFVYLGHRKYKTIKTQVFRKIFFFKKKRIPCSKKSPFYQRFTLVLWVTNFKIVTNLIFRHSKSCDFKRSNCLIYIKSVKKSGKKSGKIGTFTKSVLTLHPPLIGGERERQVFSLASQLTAWQIFWWSTVWVVLCQGSLRPTWSTSRSFVLCPKRSLLVSLIASNDERMKKTYE